MDITPESLEELEDMGFLGVTTYMFFNRNTQHFYIGSSGNTKRRIRDHLRELRNGTHPNPRFQNAFNQDSNFEFAPVPMMSRDEALQCEDLLIKEHIGDPKMLNLALDVETPRSGVKASQETKTKQSVSMKEFYANGGTNPMTGKNHTSKVREHLSQKAKEQFANPEARALASQKAVERFTDPAVREVYKTNALEQWSKPEIRQKMSESSTRRWVDPVERQKQSERCKTRFDNPENRAQCSKAGSAAWDDPEFRVKKCRRVSVDGKIYETMTEAATAHGVAIATVINRANSESPQFAGWLFV